jgi:hypothetical protein
MLVVIVKRGFGEDGIYFDHIAECQGKPHHKCCRGRWLGAISLGYGLDGKRQRRKVSGGTKQEVRDKQRQQRGGSQSAAACHPAGERRTVRRAFKGLTALSKQACHSRRSLGCWPHQLTDDRARTAQYDTTGAATPRDRLMIEWTFQF